jgi:FAD dependent oxidoreductase
MTRTKRVVIGGAGAGGLAAGFGLIEAGYDVVVLEKRPRHCEVQSGPKGGQARRHGGAFYAGLPQIARAIRKESDGLYNIPYAIKQIGAVYFVHKQDRSLVVSGWQEAQIPFHEDDSFTSLLSSEFCMRHDIKSYITVDQIIDAERLANFLKLRFESGGSLELTRKVVRSEIEDNEIKTIIAESANGEERRYPCDLWINITGAWQNKVEQSVNPEARPLFPDYFGWTATPVWRGPWNWNGFSSNPFILQFYGDFNSQLLKQLSIIPVAGAHVGNVVAISTADENKVDDPDNFYELSSPDYAGNQQKLEDKYHELQELLSEGLGKSLCAPLGTAYNADHMSWCVKSFLIHPDVKRKGIDWGALFITVIPIHRYFGGAKNSIVASPGKLGSVLEFGTQVVQEVNRYFDVTK